MRPFEPFAWGSSPSLVLNDQRKWHNTLNRFSSKGIAPLCKYNDGNYARSIISSGTIRSSIQAGGGVLLHEVHRATLRIVQPNRSLRTSKLNPLVLCLFPDMK